MRNLMVSGYILTSIGMSRVEDEGEAGVFEVDLAPQGLTNRTKRMLNIFLVLAVRCHTFHNAQESTPA